MGTAESKYRDEILRPYVKDFDFSEIENQAFQYQVRFLHQVVLEKFYPGDNLTKTAIAKYYVMLDRFADFDLDSRKEQLEMTPQRLLDEALCSVFDYADLVHSS